MEYNNVKNPELVELMPNHLIGYFTSVAEDLDWRLPKTNPASDQGETWTRLIRTDCKIISSRVWFSGSWVLAGMQFHYWRLEQGVFLNL